MEIQFKTLTPLFTGSEEGKHKELRIPGLLGSLRFWAAAAARGLGWPVLERGAECDVIENDGTIDTKKLEALDPVTRLFGATGWKRIFNLDATPSAIPAIQGGPLHVLSTNFGWRLSPGMLLPWNSSVTVRNHFRKPLDPDVESFGKGWLALTWSLIHWLTGIGAHQGWGYGQVRLINPIATLNKIKFAVPGEYKPCSDGLPDLADFVFAEYEFEEEPHLEPLVGNPSFFEFPPNWRLPTPTPLVVKPVGLSLRYALRKPGGPFELWGSSFFGDRGEAQPAGRLNGSFIFRTNNKGEPDPLGNRFRFRLWAWLPKDLFQNEERPPFPDWCTAATMLKTELSSAALWRGIANCAPKECHFWPLTPSAIKDGLKPMAPILTPIEQHAKKDYGRTCIP